MQERDNILGTESWINRKPMQELSAQLAEENKDESLLGSIGNTVSAYLNNPGIIIQAATESLPYAAGLPGIIGGTTGQFTQNQSDANIIRGKNGLPTRSDVEESLAWNALDSGLNFAENLVNARALAGLSNSAITAPVRNLSQGLANTALGRTGSNVLSRTGLSAIANTAGRVLPTRAAGELATAMGVNALTGAAQNQIENRNLLGIIVSILKEILMLAYSALYPLVRLWVHLLWGLAYVLALLLLASLLLHVKMQITL